MTAARQGFVRPGSRWCAGLIVGGVAAAVGASCDRDTKPAASISLPVPASAPAPVHLPYPGTFDAAVYPEYAGSASCRPCHREIYDEWAGSHHALAQRPLRPELDDRAFNPPRRIVHGSRTDEAAVVDGVYTLTTVDATGANRPFHPQYALGVDPLWQYLIPFPGGRWQMTELAFDPRQGDWFNVFGREDRRYWEWGHWSQRGMNWNSMCAICHTSAFRKNYRPQDDSYASTYLEFGVGCEQCHGPLRRHVQWQNAHPDGGYFGDRTVPRLSAEQQLAVCASCHTRRGDLTGAFRPGEAMVDHFDMQLPDLGETFYPDGQILDEDFEYNVFSLSYMRAAGVRCTNCHLPHSARPRLEGNALCMQCHAAPAGNRAAIDPAGHGHHPPGKGGSLCTDCHMPRTVYMARHWRHDHGQTIPDPLLTVEFGIPNACSRCHADKPVEWALDYCRQWYGPRMNRPTRARARLLAAVKRREHDRLPDLLDMLAGEENPAWRTVQVNFLRDAVHETRDPALRDRVRQALVERLADPSPLVQSAAVEALEPLAPTLVEALLPLAGSHARLVRIKAAWALRDRLPPDSPAVRELVACLGYTCDQPAGAFRRAGLLRTWGRLSEALDWFRRSVEWDPGSAPFRHGYAVALSGAGRLEEALAQLVKASELEPGQAVHPYSMGLLYAEMGRLPEATQALRAAVARDPGQGRYWYNLALAEARLGRLDECLEAFARAEELEPQAPDYPYARATILLQAGQPDRARAALEETLRIDPDHREARNLIRQAGG